MTATLNESATAPAQGATGRIARVIGPVVDVEFPAGQVPDIYNALTADLTLNGTTRKITFETAQHLGDSLVRAISLQQTDGLVRGQAVVDTGAPISVPVGDGVKGHIFPRCPQRRNQGRHLLAHPPRSPRLRRSRRFDRDAGNRHQVHRPADPLHQGR